MDTLTEIANTISEFVAHVNSGTIDAALACFTRDPTIIEDIAPYKWQGSGAGERWLAAMAANAERLSVNAVVMQLGKAERIEIEGSAAYAIFGGTVLLKQMDKALQEAGLLTFALERQSDRWLIAGLTWTGERAAPV